MALCKSTRRGGRERRVELQCFAADSFSSDHVHLEAAARAAGGRRSRALYILDRYWRQRAVRALAQPPTFNKETSRYLKITAFIAAPYKQSLFLDSDAVPCVSQMQLFAFAGFQQAFDFELAVTHVATTRLTAGTSDQKLADHFHACRTHFQS